MNNSQLPIVNDTAVSDGGGFAKCEMGVTAWLNGGIVHVPLSADDLSGEYAGLRFEVDSNVRRLYVFVRTQRVVRRRMGNGRVKLYRVLGERLVQVEVNPDGWLDAVEFVDYEK